MSRLKKGWQVGGPMANRLTLYKCRSCNRTDRKEYNPDGNVSCNHCSSVMEAIEVRYKCVRCGHIEWMEVGAVGKSCHKCGYRIFVKPRKEGTDRGYKILKAR